MESRKRRLFDASRCLGGHEYATMEELLARSVRARFMPPQALHASKRDAVSARARQQQQVASQMKMEEAVTTAKHTGLPAPEDCTGCYIDEGMYSHSASCIWDARS